MIQNNSLVVVLPYMDKITPDYVPFIQWYPIGDEKHEYVVREIVHKPGVSLVLFEEGCMGVMDGWEIGLNLRFVREVQPPMNLTNIIEECIQKPVPA